MSMSEERFSGELPEARASSVKIALGVSGVVIGLAVLLCGGVAAYVALTTTDSGAPAEPPMPPKADPAQIREVARRIIAIDLPADFEPITGEPSQMMSRVLFRRNVEEGAFLKLARVDLSSIPAGSDTSQAGPMILQMLDRGDERDAAMVLPDPASHGTTREFTVLGQTVTFEFADGTAPRSGTPVKKVRGVFRTQKAYIGLVYVIPLAEYDEEQFLEMIESIQPAPGDSAPDVDAAESPGNSGAKASEDGSGKSAPADDKPDDAGKPGPDDGQGAPR